MIGLNHRGLFPGPQETLEAFTQRVETLPAVTQPFACPKALERVREIFAVSADWVKIVVQPKGLLPWEAAATWIEEVQGARTCQIQIKHSILSRLYPQEEVVAHEMVHAMRLMFDERRFEEVLAYRTSKNRFRRYFGPLFSNSWDVVILLTLFFVPWVSCGLELLFDWNLGGSVLSLLPLVYLAFKVLQLHRTQSLFQAALSNLDRATRGKGVALATALHLTDEEIALFARLSPQEICAVAEREKERSPRWLQLHTVYF